MLYIIVTCALHLYFLTVRRNIGFREALEHGAGSAVGFSISLVVIWPVLALLSYHLRVRFRISSGATLTPRLVTHAQRHND